MGLEFIDMAQQHPRMDLPCTSEVLVQPGGVISWPAANEMEAVVGMDKNSYV